MVEKRIGDKTSAAARRRLAWGDRLKDQLSFLDWTTKRFIHELEQAGCTVSRQAVDFWLAGKTAPSPENQLVIAKVLRTSPSLLFPLDAVPA